MHYAKGHDLCAIIQTYSRMHKIYSNHAREFRNRVKQPYVLYAGVWFSSLLVDLPRNFASAALDHVGFWILCTDEVKLRNRQMTLSPIT